MKGQLCPRCGKNVLTGRDALSRYRPNDKAIYVCDECGTDEALRNWQNNPLPYSQWACNRDNIKDYENS